ncbi:MAG TPA: alpha/beta fold hydrolase [Thermoanaerobaculia bacterium]|nr:alpha/beta fold hydrolase [Thermoanaerobaculia bacterium]
MDSDFSPAWFLPGAHLQTIWGRMTRRRRMVPLRRETIETPDGDELMLDHLDADSRLHFILLHGLEGSSNSVYMQGVLSVIAREGHAATAINFRSCARDPRDVRRMLPNRRPRFYHSGETGDFDFVLRMLAARHPHRRLLAFGASLGGNVLLKWLGDHPGQQLITAAATLSVPYDLGAGSAHLDRDFVGRLYVARFLATLKKKVLRGDLAGRVDLDRVRSARSFRDFDDCATGPLHGFTGADDYYERSSSIRVLDRITTPVLAVSAEDDPFLPREVLERVKRVASPAIDFRVTRKGGHVGFIGGTRPWQPEYWAEELVVRWLIDKAAA